MKKLALLLATVALITLSSCNEEQQKQTELPFATETIVIPPTDETKEKGYLDNGVEYIIDSDIGCHISGVGSFSGEELIIPETDKDGRHINYIDDYAFKGCTAIKKVVISKNVKEIHGGAFQDCSGIESVTFAEGLERIEVWAFYGCSSVTSFKLPSTLEFIGVGAFSGCSSVTSYTVEEGGAFVSRDGVLYNKDMTTLVKYPIGNNAKSFTVPEGVKVINNTAFEDCSYIENVTMASTVENIADHAFRRCSKIKTLTLSAALTRIGVGSFYECKSLATVNYPGTKETWDDDEKINLANTWDRGTGKYTINYEYQG